MISLWITVGLALATFGVASLGAYFSITGLAALFSGALLAVCLMAGSLEFAKFMLAAYLHQTWKSLNIVYKSYLTFAIVTLSVITSVGIYGFLSDAYQSASSVLEAETVKTESIKTQQGLINAEIARLTKMVEEIPETRISRRLKMRAEVEPQVAALTKKYNDGERQLTESNLKLIEVKRKVGPLIYIAKATNMNIDKVVSYLILILVSVFDPLAICLVMATTNAIESRRRGVRVEAYGSGKESAHVVAASSAPAPVQTEKATAAPVFEVPPSEIAGSRRPDFENGSLAPVDEALDSEDVIVQMNFKDESEDKKAV